MFRQIRAFLIGVEMSFCRFDFVHEFSFNGEFPFCRLSKYDLSTENLRTRERQKMNL